MSKQLNMSGGAHVLNEEGKARYSEEKDSEYFEKKLRMLEMKKMAAIARVKGAPASGKRRKILDIEGEDENSSDGGESDGEEADDQDDEDRERNMERRKTLMAALQPIDKECGGNLKPNTHAHFT